MTVYHGKGGAFSVDDSGGVLRDLSQWCTQVQFSRSKALAGSNAFGDDWDENLPGRTGGSIQVTFRWDDTATTGPDDVLSGIVDPITADPTQTFEAGPSGSAAGRVRYTGECRCTSYQVSAPLEGVVSATATFSTDGAVTRDVFV